MQCNVCDEYICKYNTNLHLKVALPIHYYGINFRNLESKYVLMAKKSPVIFTGEACVCLLFFCGSA